MNTEKRSRKILILATALAVIALGAIIAVYATAILGTFTGGPVTVVQITGAVTYSSTNDPTGVGTWSSTLQTVSGSSWYARLEITGTEGYSGSVTVTFNLQEDNAGTWTNVGTSVTTNALTLTGAGQIIYAAANGDNAENTDWSTMATSGGTYQVVATVSSAS